MTTVPEGLTVVFDLDGTLVDTAPDLLATLNTVLGNAGYGEVGGQHMRAMVGKGARYLIEEGLNMVGAHKDESLIDGMFDEFLELYERNIDLHSRPFDGVVEVLDQLQGAGVKLGVCTNKREHLSVELLRRLDLLTYFPAILGADTLPVHKPDPAHLTQTIFRLQGDENRAVLVGDSITDVTTAKNAGIPVIVVDFGYTDIAPAELGGDHLVSHYREIPGALSQLFPPA